MRVAIDVRSLEIHRTRGLGRYARNLVNSISQIDSENEYLLFYRRSIKRGDLEVGDNFKGRDVVLKTLKRPHRLDPIMDQLLLPMELFLNGTVKRELLGVLKLAILRRAPAYSNRQFQKILVIRLDRVGDVVLSLPAIRALRGTFPRVRIYVVDPKIRTVFTEL